MARLYLKKVQLTGRIPVNTPEARQHLSDVNAAIINAAKQEAPYKTGWRPPDAPHIRDSFESEVVNRGAFLQGVVSNTAPHALFVHGGAAPHSYGMPETRLLRFWWENRNMPFRGPRVDHPGQQANPFLTRAAESLGYDVLPAKFS